MSLQTAKVIKETLPSRFKFSSDRTVLQGDLSVVVLLELMLYVPANSYDNVGPSPPVYGTNTKVGASTTPHMDLFAQQWIIADITTVFLHVSLI